MEPEWRQAYDGLMDVIRRRMEFCDRWREETVRDARERRISEKEFLTEMDRIKVEMDRTKDALERLGKTIEKWEITD